MPPLRTGAEHGLSFAGTGQRRLDRPGGWAYGRRGCPHVAGRWRHGPDYRRCQRRGWLHGARERCWWHHQRHRHHQPDQRYGGRYGDAAQRGADFGTYAGLGNGESVMTIGTAGTNANNSLTACFFPGSYIGPGGVVQSFTETDADIATINQAIKDDQNITLPAPGGGNWGWSRNGQLYVPNRGWLKILPGDLVCV